jgi:hypothetical protein
MARKEEVKTHVPRPCWVWMNRGLGRNFYHSLLHVALEEGRHRADIMEMVSWHQP